MNTNCDTAIIGSGIAGLTAAYELSKTNIKTIVIEKENYHGGVIMPMKINNYYIEGYYHHVFVDNHYLFKLAKELNIEFKFYPTSTAFLFGDTFYELTSAYDLARFDKLSLADRLKLGKFLAKILLIKDIASYDEITAKNWIIKNIGITLYQFFFEPMLISKFGKNVENTSAAWFLGRIKMRSARTKEGEMLGYLDGGFKSFIEAMKNAIINNGSSISLNTKVLKIEKENDGSFKITTDKSSINSRSVISTVPPHILLKITDFPENYKQNLSKLEYQKTICVLMGLKKKLSNYYWINIMNKEINFKAIIEHTNFQDISIYNEHIVYFAAYVDDNSNLWAINDNDLIEIYIADIKKIFPHFNSDDINWTKVNRSDSAGLIYNIGLRKLICDCTTPIKGFFIGGMMNCYPKRPMNAACIQGLKCVKLVKEYLK
ncbi:FAD-dependent oxidoreductase [Candidatus Poribacteria bacterium]|nr:FAD-dependent oxidoreductase [Candidatus Poribacteria bacterium]